MREGESAEGSKTTAVTALIIIFTTFPSIGESALALTRSRTVSVGRLAAGPPGLPSLVRGSTRRPGLAAAVRRRAAPSARYGLLHANEPRESSAAGAVSHGYALRARRMHAFFPSNCHADGETERASRRPERTGGNATGIHRCLRRRVRTALPVAAGTFHLVFWDLQYTSVRYTPSREQQAPAE